MPRFSLSKMMADPAKTQLNDDFQPAEDVSLDSTIYSTSESSSNQKKVSRTRSRTSNKSTTSRSSMKSLNDLEDFARALQRANPKVVADAMGQADKYNSRSPASA